MSEKLNLNTDFNDNLLLTSKFYKNRKTQIDTKNNLINFFKKDFSLNSKNYVSNLPYGFVSGAYGSIYGLINSGTYDVSVASTSSSIFSHSL